MTAKATPKYGYEFKNWTENGTQVSTDASYTFEIEGDRNLVANFVENNLSIEVVSTTVPTYKGASDGKIEVKAKSGTAPYICELGSDKSEPVETSYVFENLAAGSYTVKVTDATGFSVTTTVVLEDSSIIPPPSNVKAVSIGETSIKISWDPVEDAVAYGIYCDKEWLGGVYGTSVLLNDLNPETTYCFAIITITGIDNEGHVTGRSDSSEEACATTGDGSGEVTEVLPPTNVKAVANGTTITLSWDAVDGALAYGVFCDGEFAGGTYNTSVIFEDLTLGTTYCYTVVSITEIDSEGYITGMTGESDEVCATISDGSGDDDDTEILPPSNVKAVAMGPTSIKLSWDSVEGAVLYGIFKDGEFFGGVGDTFVEVGGLDPETTYCFTVITITSVDSQGNVTESSRESDEVCVTTAPDAVVELSTLFNVYPNPVNDKLYIETEVEIDEVVIYDAFGRQQTTDNRQQSSVVDVSNLDSGAYIVMIRTNDGIVTKRFVKK